MSRQWLIKLMLHVNNLLNLRKDACGESILQNIKGHKPDSNNNNVSFDNKNNRFFLDWIFGSKEHRHPYSHIYVILFITCFLTFFVLILYPSCDLGAFTIYLPSTYTMYSISVFHFEYKHTKKKKVI